MSKAIGIIVNIIIVIISIFTAFNILGIFGFPFLQLDKIGQLIAFALHTGIFFILAFKNEEKSYLNLSAGVLFLLFSICYLLSIFSGDSSWRAFHKINDFVLLGLNSGENAGSILFYVLLILYCFAMSVWNVWDTVKCLFGKK